MTDVERSLWTRLRHRQQDGLRFRRQAPIGPYIVDFVCLSRKLVIELDGSQHADRQAYDDARTRWLEAQGFRVLRFWNDDMRAPDDVVDGIWAVVLDRIRRGIPVNGRSVETSPIRPFGAPSPSGGR